MNDDKLYCVVTYYSDTNLHTNCPPVPYMEARDLWLQATDQGRKFVLKTEGCWVKIESADSAPPYQQSKPRKRK